MSVVTCSGCNKQISTNDKFCTSCGTPITQLQIEVTSQEASTYFLGNARQGLNKWWVWTLGIVSILFIWQVLGSIPWVTACEYLKATPMSQFKCDGTQIIGDSTIPGYFLSNFGFIIGIIGIWLTVRLIHKKSLTQVVTGRATFDYNRVIYAIWIGFLLNLVLLLLNIFIFHQDMTFRSPNPWEYLTFFLLAIVFTSYQASFEEVFFRGYLLQGISLISSNKIVLVIAVSVLFVAAHLINPEIEAIGYTTYVTSIALMAVFFSVVTLFDGGIELAVGYHAINNLWIILVSNTDVTPIPSPSLFELPINRVGLFPDVFMQLALLVAILVIFNRKYRWFSWN